MRGRRPELPRPAQERWRRTGSTGSGDSWKPPETGGKGFDHPSKSVGNPFMGLAVVRPNRRPGWAHSTGFLEHRGSADSAYASPPYRAEEIEPPLGVQVEV